MILKAAALGMTGLAAPAVIGGAAGGTLGWREGDPFSLGVASGAPSITKLRMMTPLAALSIFCNIRVLTLGGFLFFRYTTCNWRFLK
jgi:hypothetical protein